MNEQELRRIFGELARAEERAAPPFRPPALAPLPRRTIRPLLVVAAAAMLMVFAGAFLRRLELPTAETAGTASSIASWSAPTGFLLETPGREMLSSVSYDAVAPLTKSTTQTRRQR
jgi:hypothetical protein